MAASSNETLRNSGFWLQRLGYWLLSTLGFVLGLGLRFWAGLILGVLLLWYGLPNLLSWNSGSPGPASTGPGQYTPLPPAGTGPVATPAPSQRLPPLQGQATVTSIPAVPAPDLQGIEPPKPLPPLPDTPPGVVRGYQPPLPSPSRWPF